MRVAVLSMNHRTAGVALRERLALAEDRLPAALVGFRQQFPHAEAVLLSTCNRTELYLARPSHAAPTPDQARAFLADCCGAGEDDLTAACVHREQDQAMRHLVEVCCGLDSMVLGEPQILGQVKRAYESAAEHRVVGPALHLVFQRAIAAAKRVRTSSGIDAGRVSVGAVAVDFARNIFEDFSDKTVLGIGAGEMAKVTLGHLRGLKPDRLWVVNRTADRAAALADALGLVPPRGGAQPWDRLDDLLVEADVVVTSTGAAAPILTAGGFKPLVKRRRGRPLFVIDLAVPRDVEPAVGEAANVYLYNLDDLQSVLAQTTDQRTEAAARCEGEVHAAVQACMNALRHRDAGGVAKALRHRLQAIAELERQRTARKLANAEATDPAELEAVLAEHTRRVVNKILHLPLSRMNPRDAEAPTAFYAAALRRLFDLPEEDGEDGDGEEAKAPAEPGGDATPDPDATPPPPSPGHSAVEAPRV